MPHTTASVRRSWFRCTRSLVESLCDFVSRRNRPALARPRRTALGVHALERRDVPAAFQVNTAFTSDQTAPVVAANTAGDSLVVWQSYGQDGSGWGVYAQRYDAAGNRLGGYNPGDPAPTSGELRVNATTAGDQHGPA